MGLYHKFGTVFCIGNASFTLINIKTLDRFR